jgi:serine/threonine-protein kinase
MLEGEGGQSHPEELSGKTISHYVLESKLGAGGMGVVYRAFDKRLHRRVALKILPEDTANNPALRGRLEHEARAASAISHGHVAHIYEVGESGGACFIAMEYVEGKTLGKLMAERRLTEREILEIAVQVADALDVANAKGIVHRDLKPSNIMIDGRGESKVLDFGLAHAPPLAPQPDGATATQTAPGVVMGTAQYMSPEQALGRTVDHRSDIFSFGAVLYEMATGRMAFRGEAVLETLVQVLQHQPPPIDSPEISGELARIIFKCLEKERERRYQTTAELLAELRDLRRLHESQYISGSAIRSTAGLIPRSPGIRARWTVVAAAAAVAAAMGGSWYFHRGPLYDSLAVLPMANASGDPEQEYLADGVTESLINRISRMRGIRVVSSSSVFRLKGKQPDAQAAARQLHVKALLTGSVSEKDGVMRVSVELSDARSNAHLWGEQYTRQTTDAYRMEEDIARDLADRLTSNLSGAERQAIGKRDTDNVLASRLYFKGRYYWNKRTIDSLRTAVDMFQQAIDKDPTYALAYAGMADSYMLLSNVMPPGEGFGKSKAAAGRALELDKKLAEPYATLGYIALHYDWNWQRAESNLKRAIELGPNYPTAHSIYGRYLSIMGRYPQSVEEMLRAQELDPLSPGISTGVGLCYYLARHYDEAITQYRKILEMEPRFPLAMLDLGDAYVQKHQFPEAIEIFRKALAITPNDAGGIAQLGHAYAIAGRKADALSTLDRLKELAGKRYVSSYYFALVHAGLGNTEEAVSALDRGYTERTAPLVLVKAEPAFDPIRQDPRFKSLMVRMRLP